MNEILSTWGGRDGMGMQISVTEGKLQGGAAGPDSERGSKRLGL